MKYLLLPTFALVQLTALFSFANTSVIFETNKGNIEILLADEKAPVTVANFLAYVDSGFYEGTIFHRVIQKFVIQGGGHTPDMAEKPTMDPIVNEAKNGLSNLRGTIAMARTNEINSATSQFFINTVDNVRLDYQSEEKYGYAVFGTVVNGLEIVDTIAAATTQTVGEYQNVPVDPIIVNKIIRK